MFRPRKRMLDNKVTAMAGPKVRDYPSLFSGFGSDKKTLTEKYMYESSLHGLKYIVEKERHYCERLFWIICSILAWAASIYLVYQIIQRWNKSPILVSFASTQTPIWEIPFPSVTICNMNKVRLSRVRHVEEELALHPDDDFLKKELRFVDEICQNAAGYKKTAIHSTTDTGDLSINGSLLHTYMEDLGQPCHEMIKRCYFEGKDRNCSEIFTPVITDEGHCCSFNIMPEFVMFKDHGVPFDEKEAARWSNWSLQTGYNGPPMHANVPDYGDEPLPRRGLAPGLHMGISLLIDVHEDEYYCSGTESIGFKTLMHSPVTLPEMVEYGFAIAPGTEGFYAVSPELMRSSTDINRINVDKRQCYLEGEKTLEYFHYYTFLNCFMECAANHTFKQCDCVAYYMPRHAKFMPICAPEKHDCVEKAMLAVEENAYDSSHESSTNCHCLPACTELHFPHETSTSKLSRSDLLDVTEVIIEENPAYTNDTYVQNNLAVVHIYFKHLHFLNSERNQLFGILDFFSNIGGLLGLCLGLSAISVLEFLYFFTMRLFFNRTLDRVES